MRVHFYNLDLFKYSEAEPMLSTNLDILPIVDSTIRLNARLYKVQEIVFSVETIENLNFTCVEIYLRVK